MMTSIVKMYQEYPFERTGIPLKIKIEMKNQTTKGAFGNLNPKNKLLAEKLIEIDSLVKGLEQTGLMTVQEYADIVADKFSGSTQYAVMKHNTERLITVHLTKDGGEGYVPNIYFNEYAVEYWRDDTRNPEPSEVSEVGYGILVKYYLLIQYS